MITLVFSDKKTDKIILLDTNKNTEIQDGLIEAGARIVIERTPITKSDPIELTYNPKQFLDQLDTERRNRLNMEDEAKNSENEEDKSSEAQ